MLWQRGKLGHTEIRIRMLEELAPNVHLQRHALRLAGCRMGRVVTVIRLASGKLVIHSTAAFAPEAVAEIRMQGEPGWLVEATNFHDTMAKAGRAAFPNIPYLVPPGFKNAASLNSMPLTSAPPEWEGELDVIAIGGMPKIREHAFYHRPSKTLIIADLFFNLPPESGAWTLGFMRVMAGIRRYPGMSRLFRLCIKDRAAFTASMREIAGLDFEQIVVAHGDPVRERAKATFIDLMTAHGFEEG